MKKNLIFLFLIFSMARIQAQHLAAYSDYQDHFYIFDHGKNIQVEDVKVQSFRIGGTCVLYVNNQGQLKLYENGSVIKLESGGDISYYATDHLAAYSIYQTLKVIENGQAVTLCMRCPQYKVEDSLIVFYDENKASLRVYYNGAIADIESGLIGKPFTYMTSGDNIVAYISSRSHDFKIFYNGVNTTILRNIGKISFKAGKDIVAYINTIDNSFHIYYKGEDQQVEDYPPKAYQAGDGFIAYIDFSGAFKVFYHGDLIEAGSFPPDKYLVEDNLLLYTEDKYFKIFYNGEVFEVEGYVPSNFKLDWNTVAYLDNTNRIWLFTKGEKKFLSSDMVNSFEIYRDLVLMNVKVNRNIIYYQGQYYEGTSY
jgi:hypothetical protein